MSFFESLLQTLSKNAPPLTSVAAQSAPAVPVEVVYPISMRQLTTVGVNAKLAFVYFDLLNRAATEFDIVTPLRAGIFLAQVAHESGLFVYTSELWGPTPAQARYEGSADLGNTQPGDGARFKGHGLIQITGRANHATVASYFGVPLDHIVGWLTLPDGACRSAAWYWAAHHCNELADASNFDGVTRAINGGLNGLAQRRDLWEKIKAAQD